jgi:lysophospholipase L1-like esterase
MFKFNLLKITFAIIYCAGFAEAYCRWLVPKIMIGPSFTVSDPDVGWISRKAFTGRRVTREFDMRFTTGAAGFRGGDYEKTPPAGTTRIASLGNSQTFGVGVNDDETYSHLLEGLLRQRVDPKIEVVNMSITDTGTGIILAKWDEILSYHPDLLLIRYDDYNYLAPRRLWNYKDGQLVRSGRDAKGKFRTWMAQWKIPQELESLATYGFARILISRHMSSVSSLSDRLLSLGHVPEPRETKRNWDELEFRLLGELLDRCAQENLPLVLATFELKPERRKMFDELTSRPGVIVVDLPGRDVAPDYYYKIDEHLNARGHRHVAEKLAEEFASRWSELTSSRNNENADAPEPQARGHQPS